MSTAIGLMSDLSDCRKKTQEKIDHYHDLYFSLKKRKDIKRAARSRQMKAAEKDWRFWKSIQSWEEDMFDFNKL